MASNLVKCTRCSKISIEEEYDVHRCMPKVKDHINIDFSTYLISKDIDKTIVTVMGLNGILYEFNEIPENKEYTKIPYQPKGNKYNNYRRGNSTLKQYPYKVLVPYHTVW